MDWKNKLPHILNRLRFQLYSRKYDGMERVFSIFSVKNIQECDRDQSGSLDRYEFEAFLSKVGMFVSTQEQTELFRYYDKNGDGHITVPQFLQAFLDQISDSRLSVIKQTYQFLDSQKKGILNLQELFRKFDSKRHPRVITREKTPQQVLEEFQIGVSRYSQGGSLSEEGFLGYYASVSASIPLENDDYFKEILFKSWGVGEQSGITPTAVVDKLEDIVFEKVRQRCTGKEDEGRTMLRVFRYFDRDGSGAISFSQFREVMVHWGCVFSNQELRSLFNRYDTDNSGTLVYEEFVAAFAIKGADVTTQFSATRRPPDTVIDRVKKELLRRGMNGIRGLGIIFRRMDNNRDKKLDKYEFEWGLRENGHNLSPLDLERLFQYFDRNKDGRISYDQFLRAIRGELNDFRKGFVEQAFKKLDRSGDGKVNLEDMRMIYDVSFHPDFKLGKKGRDDLLAEFMGQWDTLDRDGNVTLVEFEDYYKDISASVDRDDEFELMMRNAWHLAGGEGQTENTTIPRYLETGPDGQQRVVMASGHETFNYQGRGIIKIQKCQY